MSRTQRLWAVLLANLALVVTLAVVGSRARSLGVWAEAIDYIADAAGIGAALVAIHLAAPTPQRPAGRPRITRVAALLNAAWLLVLNLAVVVGSTRRLLTRTPEVHGLPVLVVSAIAAATMLAGALLLGGDLDDEEGEAAGDGDGDEMTMRAVLLDTAADAAAAAGVAAAGAVIAVTGRFSWLDSAVALAIGVVVAVHALRLLRRVGASLRPGPPAKG